MTKLRSNNESDNVPPSSCDVSIVVCPGGVHVELEEETCFIPKAHISGLVLEKEIPILKIHCVNRKMSYTFTRYSNLDDIYNQIVKLLKG